MSWGTIFNNEEIIYRIYPKELKGKLEEYKENVQRTYDNMLTLMAMDQPAEGYVIQGEEKIEWAEYVLNTYERIKEELEENIIMKYRIQHALDVQEFHPENVKEY